MGPTDDPQDGTKRKNGLGIGPAKRPAAPKSQNFTDLNETMHSRPKAGTDARGNSWVY